MKVPYKTFWYLVRPSGLYYEITIMDKSFKGIIREDVKLSYTESCNYCRNYIDNLIQK